MSHQLRALLGWLVMGWIGFALMSWHSPVLALFLCLPLLACGVPKTHLGFSLLLWVSGLGGVGRLMWETFGGSGGGGVPLHWDYGVILILGSFLFFVAQGLASRGVIRGETFVVSVITFVMSLVLVFVFYPVCRALIHALITPEGLFSVPFFVSAFKHSSIWGWGCLSQNVSCGVAWNSLFLALITGFGSTTLGLAFALMVTRTGFQAKKLLRVISMLPIITPPFVIGLAVILLFGRSGAVTTFLEWAWDIAPSRWIYGFWGILFAQLLAFTPIAFLVLIGVVEGISPSLEEASQTLGASRWKTFWTVSLPLMRPGLANAFLLGFIESLADFGNPLVLGGNYDVLATDIYFAIAGAQSDQARAATLALVLLGFSLAAFYAQRRWLGKKSYTAFTGKGDVGMPVLLPRRVRWGIFATTLPWGLLTLIIYSMIVFGGFVEVWGLDHQFTFRHYLDAFAVEWTSHGLLWRGSAWHSFWTTLGVAALAAPLTALMGLLTAYILARVRFSGLGVFEFLTFLTFAIPGTVIGVSYILAFNVPPIEITGTGAILIVCFLFRNMPVSVRSGMANLSQIDKSLDESSLTLRASTVMTLRKVIFPLLRPAVVSSLVYGFVRSMTTLSAVIFLVSANYDLSTTYIVGRVENGQYGVAIAYSSVLIGVMLMVIVGIQLGVGKRQLGRRGVLS